MKPKSGTRWVEWANDRCTAQMRYELQEDLKDAFTDWQGRSLASTDPKVTQAFERWRALMDVSEFLTPKAEDDDADK